MTSKGALVDQDITIATDFVDNTYSNNHAVLSTVNYYGSESGGTFYLKSFSDFATADTTEYSTALASHATTYRIVTRTLNSGTTIFSCIGWSDGTQAYLTVIQWTPGAETHTTFDLGADKLTLYPIDIFYIGKLFVYYSSDNSDGDTYAGVYRTIVADDQDVSIGTGNYEERVYCGSLDTTYAPDRYYFIVYDTDETTHERYYYVDGTLTYVEDIALDVPDTWDMESQFSLYQDGIDICFNRDDHKVYDNILEVYRDLNYQRAPQSANVVGWYLKDDHSYSFRWHFWNRRLLKLFEGGGIFELDNYGNDVPLIGYGESFPWFITKNLTEKIYMIDEELYTTPKTVINYGLEDTPIAEIISYPKITSTNHRGILSYDRSNNVIAWLDPKLDSGIGKTEKQIFANLIYYDYITLIDTPAVNMAPHTYITTYLIPYCRFIKTGTLDATQGAVDIPAFGKNVIYALRWLNERFSHIHYTIYDTLELNWDDGTTDSGKDAIQGTEKMGMFSRKRYSHSVHAVRLNCGLDSDGKTIIGYASDQDGEYEMVGWFPEFNSISYGTDAAAKTAADAMAASILTTNNINQIGYEGPVFRNGIYQIGQQIDFAYVGGEISVSSAKYFMNKVVYDVARRTCVISISKYLFIPRHNKTTIYDNRQLISTTVQDIQTNVSDISDLDSDKLDKLGADDDDYAHIGRAWIGYNGVDSDWAGFGHRDQRSGTNFAFMQRGSDGLVIYNAPTGEQLFFRINDATGIRYDGSSFHPGANKGKDLGKSSLAWDDVYADDYNNVASDSKYQKIDPDEGLNLILSLEKKTENDQIDWEKSSIPEKVKIASKMIPDPHQPDNETIKMIEDRREVSDDYILEKEETIEEHEIISDAKIKSLLFACIQKLNSKIEALEASLAKVLKV